MNEVTASLTIQHAFRLCQTTGGDTDCNSDPSGAEMNERLPFMRLPGCYRAAVRTSLPQSVMLLPQN